MTPSADGYIAKVLHRFGMTPGHFSASTAIYVPPRYGDPLQTHTTDNSPLLDPAAIKTLQEQVGCLLYYARIIDSTIVPAVTHFSSRQGSPTVAVAAAMTRLLQYCARYPNNTLMYHACPMQHHIHSNASYLRKKAAPATDRAFGREGYDASERIWSCIGHA
jgi:hypothetical protein